MLEPGDLEEARQRWQAAGGCRIAVVAPYRCAEADALIAAAREAGAGVVLLTHDHEAHHPSVCRCVVMPYAWRRSLSWLAGLAGRLGGFDECWLVIPASQRAHLLVARLVHGLLPSRMRGRWAEGRWRQMEGGGRCADWAIRMGWIALRLALVLRPPLLFALGCACAAVRLLLVRNSGGWLADTGHLLRRLHRWGLPGQIDAMLLADSAALLGLVLARYLRGDSAQPDMPSQHPGRVLVIRPDHLGDLIVATPLLQAMRAAWPEARIDVLVNARGAELMRGHPAVDGLPIYSKRDRWFDRDGICSTDRGRLAGLDGKCYDLVVALSAWPSCHELAMRIEARDRVVVAGEDQLVYGVRIAPVPLHGEQSGLSALTTTLGIASLPARPLLALDAEECSRAQRSLMDMPRPLLVVCPASHDPTRRWPRRSYVAVVERARTANGGGSVLVLDAPGADPDGWPSDWKIVTGAPLREALALLSACDVFVGVDGGFAHAAAAAGLAGCTIFTSGDLRRWAPGGRLRCVQASVPCTPCAQMACNRGLACFDAVDLGAVADILAQDMGIAAGVRRA